MLLRMMVKLSVVVPIFNEERNIPELVRRLRNSLSKIKINYEVIFVNDGSRDKSLSTLKELRRKNHRIKIISLSRNFGHMQAVSAGLRNTNGRFVVLMDGDLQDPPELIPKMLDKIKEGYDVVYGVKKKRKEGFFRRFLFSLFYRILSSVSSYDMPIDAGTFSLISKKIVDILINIPERNKYISGLRSWVGFPQTGIVYERDPRFSGKPASFGRLIKLALDGIISFSYLPLRLASLMGFICATVAFVGILVVLFLRIFFNVGIIGWASTMSSILLVGGIQLITLGIIGEYLARIYDEVKNRPEYIISEKIGF